MYVVIALVPMENTLLYLYIIAQTDQIKKVKGDDTYKLDADSR